MPELPEVETIRRDLSRFILGVPIGLVEVRRSKMVWPRTLASKLRGAVITRVSRRGKLLLWELADGRYVHLHMKMTGQLVLTHRERLVFGGHPIAGLHAVPNSYTQIVIHFLNGDRLYFNDLRQFGYLRLFDADTSQQLVSHFGPEPLSSSFTRDIFTAAVKRRSATTIKAVLLNQKTLAGVGNIYADESLWRARIRPGRRVNSLTPREVSALHRAIIAVLKLSVAHRGTTTSTYASRDRDAGTFGRYLAVYGRGGKPCRRCGTILTRTVVAGRGTVYCNTCQK